MNKNSKGFAELFVLIILALAVVGGIGYYSWQKGFIKTNPRQEASPTPTVDLDETKSQSPTGDLANWKTYTEKLTGYRFQYPPEYTTNFIPYHQGEIILRPPSQEKDNPSGQIVFTPNSAISSFNDIESYVKDMISSSKEVADFYNEQDKTIGNYHFYLIDGGCCMEIGRHAFILDGNSVFEIKLIWLNNKQIPEVQAQIFNQILSTFRFLD